MVNFRLDIPFESSIAWWVLCTKNERMRKQLGEEKKRARIFNSPLALS
jgi:hypothetical protein